MRHFLLVVLAVFFVALTGCALQETASPVPTEGLAITGRVHGGQQPVASARVYLMQATTGGYNNAAADILTSGDGSDTIGKYVVSDASGGFALGGKYSCTQNTQVYVLAELGNPGLSAGTSNASLALMAVLGNCPAGGSFATAYPLVQVNEVTTVAAAFALGGFMSGPTQVSASSTNTTGLANAFALAGNLVDITTGYARVTTPNGNGTVPQSRINTLANALAYCVNSDGIVSGPSNATPCYKLFNDAPNGATIPSDTITAMLNIVHNPSANVSAIVGLSSSTAPFQPSLTTAPNDLAVGISYVTDADSSTLPYISIDSSGNIYKADATSSSSSRQISPLGVINVTYHSTVENYTIITAIDPQTQNVWVTNGNTPKIQVYNSSGTALTASGYTPVSYTIAMAFDGAGSLYSIDNAGALVKTNTSAYTNGGALVPPSVGTPHGDASIAITSGGTIWEAVYNQLYTSTTASPGTFTAITTNGVGTSGYTELGSALAVDSSQNTWLVEFSNSAGANLLMGWDSTGAAVSGSPFPVSLSGRYLNSVAVDGANTLWSAAGNGPVRMSVASGTLTQQTNINNSSLSTNQDQCQIDQSGNVWCVMLKGLIEYPGIAAPTANPASPTNHGLKP